VLSRNVTSHGEHTATQAFDLASHLVESGLIPSRYANCCTLTREATGYRRAESSGSTGDHSDFVP
jgi:hypothetical protein